MGRRRGLPVLALALATACSSFGASDAPDPAADAGGAGPPADDGGPGGASPDGSACGHKFCSGFDGTTLEQDWGAVVAYEDVGGIDLDRVQVAPRSAPFVLRGSLTAGTKGGARFVRKVFRGVRLIRFGFAFRAKEVTQQSDALHIASLGWGPSPLIAQDMLAELQLSVRSAGVGARIDQDLSDGGAGPVAAEAARPLSVDRWYEVIIEAKLEEDGDVNATYTLDGQAILKHRFAPSVPFADPEIALGVSAAYGSFTASQIDFDDVWADVEQ